MEDLRGRRGLRPFAGSYGEVFDQYAQEHLSVSSYHDTQNALRMIIHERVDYMILAYYDGLARIYNSPYRNQVAPLSYSLASNGVHVLFSKLSPCVRWIDKFNQTIDDMRRDGSIAEIIARYLEKPFFQNKGTGQSLPRKESH